MFDLVITDAGLDALVDAQNGDTDAVQVVEIGLTENAFDPAPTLTALPGEFKRVATVAGQVVAENVIHMTAQDSSVDTYDLRGFGLFLADGTLFATYGQADPIFSKVSISLFLLAFNVRFSGDIAGAIDFGDSSFLNPPATEIVRGVAQLATQAETDAGTDDETIVTPLKLGTRLAAFFQTVSDALAGFAARTISGGGLATGGGDLSEDRVITVAAASGAEVAAGTEAGKAVTPAALANVPQTFGGSPSILGLGGAILKAGTFTVPSNGTTSPVFPVAFPTGCSRVLISPMGYRDPGKEATQYVTGASRTGFSVTSRGGGSAATFAYLAIGH